MKFALHNYGGTPVKFFTVEGQDVKPTSGSGDVAPSHHIAILDVSGSMWTDLPSVKSIIEKVFTAEEFNDPAMTISLITYSSHGDCRVHFSKVTVEDVLAPNSPHLAEIRNLRVRGLTGISQSLQAAELLIDDAEVTCISLHTDGYANDPSPYSEAQHIVAVVEALEKHPNAFCNTVGYRAYCDFALLSAIANRLSGKSMQANNAREVYAALHDTQTLLAGQMSPVIEAGIGDYDFLTFVSYKAKKVLGAAESMTVRGLASDDDAMVYRYKEVTEAEYAAAAGPVCGDQHTNMDPILAYCRAQIALGNLNAAKYAMVSTRITNLIAQHSRALVASEVAEMATAVEGHLYGMLTAGWSPDYGLGETGPSILSVVQVLDEYKSSLRLNVADLMKTYQRRGLKRVAGVRNDKGGIDPPTHRLLTSADTTAVDVASIEINRDTATINIKTIQDGTLVSNRPIDPNTGHKAGKLGIGEVAGIKLDLKDFRNYTIVGDGRVNVPVLRFKTSDKRCFAALKTLGAVTGDFDPSSEFAVFLDRMPLVDYDQDFGAMDQDAVISLAQLTVVQKLLAGLTAGTSEALTPEQIAALKDHYITPALYFSPPTTNPYTDLKDALSQGEVDTALAYKVKLGTLDVTNLGKLKSGNAYLQRRFTLHGADGVEVKKPKLSDWWADGNTWAIKALTARTKLDGVDEAMYPIYANFLRLEGSASGELAEGEPLSDVLLSLGGQEEGYEDMDLFLFEQALQGGMDADEALAVFKDVLTKVNAAIDEVYQRDIIPLAFYIGATGLVPDSLGVQAMTADQLVESHPNVKLAKNEKEGTFYELPVKGGDPLLLGVFTEAKHFSTERGVAAAEKLQG